MAEPKKSLGRGHVTSAVREGGRRKPKLVFRSVFGREFDVECRYSIHDWKLQTDNYMTSIEAY